MTMAFAIGLIVSGAELESRAARSQENALRALYLAGAELEKAKALIAGAGRAGDRLRALEDALCRSDRRLEGCLAQVETLADESSSRSYRLRVSLLCEGRRRTLSQTVRELAAPSPGLRFDRVVVED
jgi:hypothetical protein